LSVDPPERLDVVLYYDFASSLCYIAHRVMERMAPVLEDLALDLRWKPLDLTQLTHWRRGDEMRELARANTERVSRELDVTLRIPHRWMDSRAAMAVALRLGESAREPTWRERVWSAVYEEGRVLDEGAELERLASELDLELDGLLDKRALEAVEVTTLLAAEENVSGVPTFMLGEWPLAGIQDERTMRSVLSRYAGKRRGLPA
jgi:predicted DsbA family dithiol-disulfide isomerase